MRTILSYGLGTDSTAILLRWIYEPSTRPCPLEDLVVLTAQTGDEYDDTRHNVETHILPLMREHGIRYVQVARGGHYEADGIRILSDTRSPDRLYTEGAYKLSDELRSAGTVPQFGGEHLCSIKFKAYVCETWLRDYFPHPSLQAFGYSAGEEKRALKSDAAIARRIAFGFSADEQKRSVRASKYDSSLRTAFYPLIEWGWTRQQCEEYIVSKLGVLITKSACVFCPFNALKADAVERHKAHPHQVAAALELELVSLTLNPRGTLYKSHSLLESVERSENTEALRLLDQRLNTQPWVVYRVRRMYAAGKDKAGQYDQRRKGNAIRAVEHATEPLPRANAEASLRALAEDLNTPIVEKRNISYAYVYTAGTDYPTREEYYVAGPAAVDEKARYGLDWFEEKWSARQTSLF